MQLENLLGMKYPDDYIIRFFFKEGLDKKGCLNVLELGCGNGNNLTLFYNYRHNVCGVDINKLHIENANHNFKIISDELSNSSKYQFINTDMLKYVQEYDKAAYDVLLIPNSIYYLEYNNIIDLIKLLNKKGIIKKDSYLFIKFRNVDDYRTKKGKTISQESIELNISETGECGEINTFFSEKEFLYLLSTSFPLIEIKLLYARYDNFMNGKIVFNSDVILWCKVGEIRR
jgi:SAM-dependent methyltransferase